MKQEYIPISNQTHFILSKLCLKIVVGFFPSTLQFKQKQRIPQISLYNLFLQNFQTILGCSETFEKYKIDFLCSFLTKLCESWRYHPNSKISYTRE